MSKTCINISGEKFLINGKLTYSEITEGNKSAQGLLMNSRFIQGIFDDSFMPERFARFGRLLYDAEQNTDELVKALPQWYSYGLRAFTIGLQGGGPLFTINDFRTIYNSPFSEDGKTFDKGYEERLHKVLRAADDIGMAVIVSIFHQAQCHRLIDDDAVQNAVNTACTILKNSNYSNVIIEIANEYNIDGFSNHPIIHSSEGMVKLIKLARRNSNGRIIGCSGIGGHASKEVSDFSDIILIHTNGCTRQQFYNLIKEIRHWQMNKPIVSNEDSPCIGKLEVALKNKVSWGYFNNLTKQEPPTDWNITIGEDTFFARRLAEGLGIKLPPLVREEQYYLQGFECNMSIDNDRWIRLASLYPESINFVEFYRSGKLMYIAYDEPYMVNYVTDWIQRPSHIYTDDEEWMAKIYLKDGQVLNKFKGGNMHGCIK